MCSYITRHKDVHTEVQKQHSFMLHYGRTHSQKHQCTDFRLVGFQFKFNWLHVSGKMGVGEGGGEVLVDEGNMMASTTDAVH